MLAALVISQFVLRMALVPAWTESSLLELGIDGSIESLSRLVDSQKKLFYSQVDHLQRVVDTHCKLTGVNPLSQEMAAGALSIKIGKKHRDLLNPKAVKYMQSVFSIKDFIGKKETREISALCGVTSTQVRDFFSGQRSKVRKLVRLARGKAARSDASEAANDGLSVNPDASTLCRSDALFGAASINDAGEPAQVPASGGSLPAIQCDEKVQVNSVDAKLVQVVSSPPSQDETLPGINEDDKKFLENIFNLMRKEGTFSGQVKLMEWILQIHNSALLVWFSTKGSITILATWLSQAAIEEQTTVLNVILKVLCHLPLHKALHAEISSILQTVNKLRFYRTPDISNKAKILLSKWSKMLVRNQTRKYPSPLNSKDGFQKEIIRKQRINEILSDDFWRSKIGNFDDILALAENSGNISKPHFRHASKLLTASCDSSVRKQLQSASNKIKERRIVRLVEQLDEKPALRNAYVGRMAASNHSRPISTDDIQKAKMRAMFMQHKYGKPEASSIDNKRIEQSKELTIPPPSNNISPAIEIMPLEQVNREEDKGAEVLRCSETPTETKPTEAMQVDCSETPTKTKSTEVLQVERLKTIHVLWVTPLEMKIDSSWRVGEADCSKELVVQAQRIQREKETFYPSTSDIPPNPKEPWDIEMDFDDSLTPEVPIEQPPDIDALEDSTDHPVDDQTRPEYSTDHTVYALPIISSCAAEAPVAVPVLPFTSSCNAAAPLAAPALPIASFCNAAAPLAVPALPYAPSGSGTEPDLELLAVLLNNPEVVFALTTGQGKNLTNNERVALLDMIKNSNAVLTGAANGMSGTDFEKPKENIPISLPSPTPPSDAERVSRWRSAFTAAANASLPQPQLPIAALHSFPAQIHSSPPSVAMQFNTVPQSATASSFISQRPSPSLSQQFLSSNYVLQQRLNVEPLTSKTYTNPTVSAPSPTLGPFQQDLQSLYPPSLPILSPLPSFPPTHMKPQLLMMSEPSAAVFPPDSMTWTWRDNNVEWNGEMAESSIHRPSVEVQLQNPRFGVSDNTHHDLYPRYQGRPTSTGTEEMDRSWSPESPPVRPSEFRHGHGRSYAGSRSERGWNQRQGWSQRQRPGPRDQYRSSSGSGGKWRDHRDRDRRR